MHRLNVFDQTMSVDQSKLQKNKSDRLFMISYLKAQCLHTQQDLALNYALLRCGIPALGIEALYIMIPQSPECHIACQGAVIQGSVASKDRLTRREGQWCYLCSLVS